MKLVDTHCHIQEADFSHSGVSSVRSVWASANQPDPDIMIKDAAAEGVTKLLCVGTTLDDSQLAIDFVGKRQNCWATIGLHPHEAKVYASHPDKLQAFRNLVENKKVVAIGECGLDYYYEHSPKPAQRQILEEQLALAVEHRLPVIFHVRDAFADFWPIVDNHSGLRGVIHSFTAGVEELEQILKRGLYIGLNGIMTFTKLDSQLAAARAVPLEKLVLETDAPFLTPHPFRGKINQPKYARVVAEFLAELRSESLGELATQTTLNAEELFGI